MAKQNKGRKFFAASATAALVASAIVPVASAAQVNDLNKVSGYAKEAVQALVDSGVIQGDAKGNFNPLNTISRAEAAEIFAKALDLDASGDVNFKDVKKGAWYYNSITAVVEHGIFEGVSTTEFAPSKSLTRSEAAKILVEAFGLEGDASVDGFADSSSIKPWAKQYLEIAVANGIFQGTDTNRLNPNNTITRQDFALTFQRTLNLEENEEVVEASSVKAINNTTVEVTFDEAQTTVKASDFSIDGLEIKNAAIKQSNNKVVVLTTASQTAEQEYTLSYRDEVIGGFKGVAAVIPTAVTAVEFENPVVEGEIGKETTTQVKSHKSQQAPLGTQVTVQAQVTVGEGQSKAGIPVTFNIVNAQGSDNKNPSGGLNPAIVAEALTDENGVASYAYTRYAATSQDLNTSDEVQVYATGNPTARDFTKVYWANTQPLTITEVTTGNKLNNGAKKVYKVKVAGVNNAAELEKKYGSRDINVGYLDNVNVAPDKANKNVTVTDNTTGITLGYPGQFTTTNSTETNRFNAVRVKLDAKGEATFTLTGSNQTVTPFVWVDDAVGNTNATIDRFDKTELAAFAAPLTFAKEQVLSVKVESLGTKDASAYEESFDRTGRYEYRNGNLVLVRDPNGQLTGASLPVPNGSTIINNTNPLRSDERVPSGFVYTELGNNAVVTGVVALEGAGKFPTRKTNQLSNTHLSKYSYTGSVKEKNEALAADLTNTGGRDYKVSYTDKDGKAAQAGQVVKVELKYGSAKTTATASVTPIYFIDNNSHTVYKVSDFSKEKETFSLSTDAKGQVSFTVIGGRDSYATPTAFVETGDKDGLDTNDAQEAGEIVYFGDRTINSAKLTIDNEDTTSKSVAEEVTFSYQSTDQNKKHYHVKDSTDFIATFQVSTTFSPATVEYTDRNGALRVETVNQGSTRSFDVKSTNGKADLKVKSVRGNRVDVTASAHNLPVLNASASFTSLNNEGIAYGQSVRGKVIAVDKENNRILLTDSRGEKVYDLKYEADELYYKGASGASEATFEAHLNVGDELFFTQKADANSKAKFDNLDIQSGIRVDNDKVIAKRNTFIIEGDYTSTLKEYDFAHNAPAGYLDATGRALVDADFQINGDNIKLSNVKIYGNVTVGRTNASVQQVLNDFALNNVEVTGTVTVNQGDGNTFVITGNSSLNRVVLNIPEHVALAGGSNISQLLVTQNGSTLTGVTGDGAGTVNELSVAPGVSITPKDVDATPTAEVPFTATTTTGDTVTLTFTAGTYANTTSLTVTPGTIGTTSGDTVTFTLAEGVVGKTFEVKFTQNNVVKTFTVVAGTVGNTATITRKY
ncbi:S-layer homology domain-containing protein [Lysinibacillus macroides]|uniref:S-layer homology domain-containing protein n=1 Tax=Lysinibacillus macroides TaxID=33935 RepID=UPI0006B66032|nr:S-layer homology domain-containing protein [Lysinibacillus macroides]QPR66661.1 S-layer homology domain-containing protein [Lysinibacillus macroides]